MIPEIGQFALIIALLLALTQAVLPLCGASIGNRTFRIGGLVEEGTLKRESDGLTVRFTVTDTAASIPVVYKGILPDLFKEGRGCVAQGRLGDDGVFRAEEVLAKHDENYMPPEAGEAIDKAKNAKHAQDAAKSVVY